MALSLCPEANLFVGVVVWALPRCCCFAESGWGICGSSWFVVCCGFALFCYDLPMCTDQSSPCTTAFHRLCFNQDRALVRHRPDQREKITLLRVIPTMAYTDIY